MKKLMLGLMMAFAVTAVMADPTVSANGYAWTYTTENGFARILNINPNPSGTLTIPSSLGGYPVKWFGWGPCVPRSVYPYDLSSVTSFDIPSSIEFLYRGDFDKIVILGDYDSYKESLWWKNQSGDVAILGEWAIGLRSSVANVTIPQGVKKIAVNFAYEYANLKSVSIPDGVKIICSQAFSGCSKLRDVHIPSSVDTIGDYAFGRVPGPFYFHGQKPKLVDCTGLTESEGGDPYESGPFDAGESDSRIIYFKRGTSGWTDGGTWCGLKTYAWDPEGGETGVKVSFNGNDKHTFNGLVYDKDKEPCGLIQVTTAKESKKGVKVSGFVMLEDSKKVTLKAATVSIQNGALNVSTQVGRLGSISLTIDGSGFKGTLGSMSVSSESMTEDTGILKATVTMSYFEAGTGKLKKKSLKLGGIAVDGYATGTYTPKNTSSKQFWAEVECSSCSPSR